ncbi:MAG: zinc ribbon domain-containing protein [Eubacteriales bacterium]|nr:zinc ribbon domain-containing protein [Eubacteriales bacterium]
MYCRYCGEEMADDAKKCPSCGKETLEAKAEAKLDEAEQVLAKAKKEGRKFFRAEDQSGHFTNKDKEKNRGVAVLAYIPLLFLVPMLTAQDSPYARYHANQGLVLFICTFAVWMLSRILSFLGMVPLVGTTLGVIFFILELLLFAAYLLGIITTSQGKAVKIPLLGEVIIFD